MAERVDNIAQSLPSVRIRAIEARDAARLEEFHARLSPESVYLRFFSVHPRLAPREVARFTNVDHHAREALVAMAGDAIVGVVRYDRVTDATAEVAVIVEDAWQRRGVGTALLGALAARAGAEGIVTFVAETLFENQRMRRVFNHMGWATEESVEHGVVGSRFSISPS